jgi:hypothetical protein
LRAGCEAVHTRSLAAKSFRLLGRDRQFFLSSTPGSVGGNGQMKIHDQLDCSSMVRITGIVCYSKRETTPR